MELEQALDAYVEKLDSVYAEIRKQMTEPDLFNPDWPPYVKLLEDFKDTMTDYFRLKGAIHRAKEMIEERPA